MHDLEAAFRTLQGDGTQTMSRVTVPKLVEFLKGKPMPDGSGTWKRREKRRRELLVDAIQVLTAPAAPQVDCYTSDWYMQAPVHDLEAEFKTLQGNGTQTMSRVTVRELVEFLKGTTMPDGSGTWKRKEKRKRELLVDAIQVLTAPT